VRIAARAGGFQGGGAGAGPEAERPQGVLDRARPGAPPRPAPPLPLCCRPPPLPAAHAPPRRSQQVKVAEGVLDGVELGEQARDRAVVLVQQRLGVAQRRMQLVDGVLRGAGRGRAKGAGNWGWARRARSAGAARRARARGRGSGRPAAARAGARPLGRATAAPRPHHTPPRGRGAPPRARSPDLRRPRRPTSALSPMILFFRLSMARHCAAARPRRPPAAGSGQIAS
jgi:hypothetical protein